MSDFTEEYFITGILYMQIKGEDMFEFLHLDPVTFALCIPVRVLHGIHSEACLVLLWRKSDREQADLVHIHPAQCGRILLILAFTPV